MYLIKVQVINHRYTFDAGIFNVVVLVMAVVITTFMAR